MAFKRRPVRIFRVPFLIPTWAHAQVIMPGTILVRSDIQLGRYLLAHELRHIVQWEERGWMFPIRYLMAGLSGYHANTFEEDARRAARNPDYLSWADDILAHL